MLKVEITNRKAPWPAGAGGVGSVVLLAAVLLPAWAAGKCIVLPPEDEREPVGTWEPPVLAEPELVVNPASAAQQLTEHAARISELGQQLLDADQALGTARAEIQSRGAQLAEAHGEVERARAAAAEAEAAAARVGADLLASVQARDALIAERDAAMADAKALRDAAAAAAEVAATKPGKKAAA